MCALRTYITYSIDRYRINIVKYSPRIRFETRQASQNGIKLRTCVVHVTTRKSYSFIRARWCEKVTDKYGFFSRGTFGRVKTRRNFSYTAIYGASRTKNSYISDSGGELKIINKYETYALNDPVSYSWIVGNSRNLYVGARLFASFYWTPYKYTPYLNTFQFRVSR